MGGEFTGDYTVFDKKNRPIFPDYKFENGKSTYRGEEVGEGGYVYAEPGIYGNVALLDIASMHPSSIVAENLFGDEYTQRFKDILDARIAIKHKDFDKVKRLNPELGKYLNDPAQAKALAYALKIVINSVYGLTAAKFQNKFKDPRNIDNWVAKRGALFMESLRLKVQAMGAKVVHIKTDSIKIEKPTPEVEQFILDYGKQWGYNFEVESIYERICLVNDAVYIAKCSKDEEALSRLAEDNERFVRMNPETAELINLITDSKLKLTVEEGTVNMCQAIQQMRERSKAAGLAEGKVEGRLETLVSLWKKNRLTLEEAAEEAEMTVDEFIHKTGVKPLMN